MASGCAGNKADQEIFPNYILSRENHQTQPQNMLQTKFK